MQNIFYLELAKQNNDQKRVLSAHAVWVFCESFVGSLRYFLLSMLGLIKCLFVKYFLGFFNSWLALGTSPCVKYRLKTLILDFSIGFRRLSLILTLVTLFSVMFNFSRSHTLVTLIFTGTEFLAPRTECYGKEKIARAAIHSNNTCIFIQA